MDKVQKHNSFNTNTPWSESYRNYQSSSKSLNFQRHLNSTPFAIPSLRGKDCILKRVQSVVT
jgi:hypothetical protein